MFDLEQLIHLIGARGGSIGRAAFDKAVWEFSKQQPSVGEAVTFRALRALDWLGHCESPGYGGRVTVYLAQPALAILPDFRNSRAVLTGARSPSTISELQAVAKQLAGTITVSVSLTVGDANAFAINRVLLEADCLDAIRHAADAVGVAVTSQPAGWELACASPSVSGFERSLHWEHHFPVPDEAHHFSPETLRFEDGYSGGLRLVRWKEASTNKIIFALREGARVAFIDGPEWGRHVELSASGASSIRYDAKRKIFAIRASCPPPRVIARALCLCSGYLPDIQESQGNNSKTLWLAFKDVPPPVADMVSEKLGQEVSSLPFQIA